MMHPSPRGTSVATPAKNKNRIEDQAEYGREGEYAERCAGVTECAKRCVDGEESEDEWHAQQVRAKVAHPDRSNRRGGAHHRKQLREYEGREQRNHDAERRAKYQPFTHRASRFERTPLAMPTRGHGIHAYAHHLANGNDKPDPKHRRCRRRERVRTEIATDPERIDVVKDRHQQIRDNSGHGYPANRARERLTHERASGRVTLRLEISG